MLQPPLVCQVRRVEIPGEPGRARYCVPIRCFNGPNRVPAQASCGAADADGDADVDVADFLKPGRARYCVPIRLRHAGRRLDVRLGRREPADPGRARDAGGRDFQEGRIRVRLHGQPGAEAGVPVHLGRAAADKVGTQWRALRLATPRSTTLGSNSVPYLADPPRQA